MHSWGDPENLTDGRSERSERFEREILWAEPGKQKERVVQGAWLTPEAVPSERERNGHNGECKAELDCLSGDGRNQFRMKGARDGWRPSLGGHPKTGQWWSPQNRPIESSQDKGSYSASAGGSARIILGGFCVFRGLVAN